MTFVALNNTYGLVVIVFLLGYGLVELPKQMWMVGGRHTPLPTHFPTHQGLMFLCALLLVIQDGNLQAKLRRMQVYTPLRHL